MPQPRFKTRPQQAPPTGTRPSRCEIGAKRAYVGAPTIGARLRAASSRRIWRATTRVGFAFKSGDLDQWIILVPRPRHFGGHQWYFVCPVMNRDCSVVWLPPGANRFCSREKWGPRRVAYASQFADPDNRAHLGQAKIRARLIGDLDPDEWDLPPKPKGMRWRTYNRYVERYDAYEATLEYGIAELMAKFLSK